jgi:hypothetical protein
MDEKKPTEVQEDIIRKGYSNKNWKKIPDTPRQKIVRRDWDKPIWKVVHSKKSPDAGKPIDQYKDEDGNYLLHLASKFENLEMIKMLLKDDEIGSSPNVYNNLGETPLHIIAANTDPSSSKTINRLNIIQAFKDANADFNARKHNQKYAPTPLHIAALTSRKPRIVEELLKHGADIALKYSDSTAKKPAAGTLGSLFRSNDQQTIDKLVLKQIERIEKKETDKTRAVHGGGFGCRVDHAGQR